MPKPNGLHHPPGGGTRESPFAGTSFKSHKLLENAYAVPSGSSLTTMAPALFAGDRMQLC